ncbi:ABC transporter substrate-binding protein [Nocardiopsis dassonvillei]|uniref:NMT1/THI5 like domain protein n=1 Tax=Nocardiopsis dassonvillei (strain ATCC 23218 / DSM 43111 / CIP 107115 / JCM 7437 / KCTC 9190 / NBRC 14626 / NCTC 10488 / NRRL B-5397 / IMRU 509) TaxID=446468 RepID=D7B810_NOCDD|nr:ABC transporter substrate-binding protein [Nocardiopsis dassonvillei]ADH70318.1 NMT1/THI5 like domain protein [Nocardiopsis dassonvillei subsp. dassonvillei DSM 43111]NKY80674.1 ABC transporter substrate-binding protein [Nocardiopsis dassonvillei]VEI91225.1 alkanesulfonate transporter substrate-binding subunit [Nocardiopsis dassonvillei]
MHTRRDILRYTAAAGAALPLLSACGPPGSGAAGASPVIRYQGWTGDVLLPELAEDLGYLDGIGLEWIGDTTSGPQDIQAAATGSTDVGGAFNGAIAKLAAAGAPVTAVLAYYGADEETHNGYYVLEDSDITGARDLVGKRVSMNTLGAHHEFVVREWLAREGLTNEEIARVELTVVPPVNAEQTLRNGQVEVATLGDLLREVALERGGIRPLFTDHGLYGAFSYGSLVLRDDFIEAHEDTVQAFVGGVARAIRWTQTTPREEVVDRYTDIIGRRGRNESAEAVRYWRSTGVAGPGGVIAPDEFRTWIDWLVRNGELDEGAVEAEELFTNDYNPYANGTYPEDSGPDGRPLAEGGAPGDGASGGADDTRRAAGDGGNR